MIDTGGGGFSGSSGASSGAGDTGNYTSSADRISKQFVNINGAAGLDASSYLGAVSAGFWQSVGQVQSDQPAQSSGVSQMQLFAVVGAGVAVGVVVMVVRGRR